MDVSVHDDQLKDMIRDVGVESLVVAHGYKIIQAIQRFHCILDQLTHTIVDRVKIDEFEGNKWMDS